MEVRSEKEEHTSIHHLRRLEVNIWLALGVFAVCTTGAVFGAVYLVRGFSYDYTLPASNEFSSKSELVQGAWPALANADYFDKVKKDFIAQQASFVEVDLSTMLLRVYKSGTVALEVPIKTKGKEGSWWETPSGLYKAEEKEPQHFSSFGKVYTKWNIQFQGNFFIHGWPFYPDGRPVASTYSGGCIRLSDDDAKKVYDLVDRGMPILVFEKDFSHDDFTYNIASPSASARGYLVADLKSNFVLLSRGAQDTFEASIAPKLMAALVASEFQNIEKSITVPQEALVPSTHPRLKAGETYTVYDLLFPLLLESSGEAANTIVYPLGTSRAVSLMRTKALAVGMTHTKFADPAGVREGNITTAEDLFQLSKYLYNNRPFILNISANRAATNTYGEPAFSDLMPTDAFIGDTDFKGGITDIVPDARMSDATTTDATAAAVLSMPDDAQATARGKNMLSIFEYTFHGEKRPIAIIVLDSTDPTADTKTMMDYIGRMYK